MPAKPRWLLAIPDAIRQLEGLDRDLLTRRDVERLFGVSRARAATLMRTFGAELTGLSLTLPRAELLRQLRLYREAGRLPRRGAAARASGDRAVQGASDRDSGAGPDRSAAGAAVGAAGRRAGRTGPDRSPVQQRYRGGAAVVCAGSGADARLRALRSGRQRGGDSGRRVRLQGLQGPAARGAGGDVITRPRDAARPSTFRGSHRVGSGVAPVGPGTTRRWWATLVPSGGTEQHRAGGRNDAVALHRGSHPAGVDRSTGAEHDGAAGRGGGAGRGGIPGRVAALRQPAARRGGLCHGCGRGVA